MQGKYITLVAVITPLTMGASHGVLADSPVTGGQVVQALEQTFGVHPGERRNHTKGTCALGEFVGNPEIARYSNSALFSGKPVPVEVAKTPFTPQRYYRG